ncbi:hypothetical protein DFH09DRAFT_1347994 [Mycena vulgaris]|nr:hypothetical protein DFH09DRAFT_1347994 [Mycena vulgaris]
MSRRRHNHNFINTLRRKTTRRARIQPIPRRRRRLARFRLASAVADARGYQLPLPQSPPPPLPLTNSPYAPPNCRNRHSDLLRRCALLILAVGEDLLASGSQARSPMLAATSSLSHNPLLRRCPSQTPHTRPPTAEILTRTSSAAARSLSLLLFDDGGRGGGREGEESPKRSGENMRPHEDGNYIPAAIRARAIAIVIGIDPRCSTNPPGRARARRYPRPSSAPARLRRASHAAPARRPRGDGSHISPQTPRARHRLPAHVPPAQTVVPALDKRAPPDTHIPIHRPAHNVVLEQRKPPSAHASPSSPSSPHERRRQNKADPRKETSNRGQEEETGTAKGSRKGRIPRRSTTMPHPGDSAEGRGRRPRHDAQAPRHGKEKEEERAAQLCARSARAAFVAAPHLADFRLACSTLCTSRTLLRRHLSSECLLAAVSEGTGPPSTLLPRFASVNAALDTAKQGADDDTVCHVRTTTRGLAGVSAGAARIRLWLVQV